MRMGNTCSICGPNDPKCAFSQQQQHLAMPMQNQHMPMQMQMQQPTNGAVGTLPNVNIPSLGSIDAQGGNTFGTLSQGIEELGKYVPQGIEELGKYVPQGIMDKVSGLVPGLNGDGTPGLTNENGDKKTDAKEGENAQQPKDATNPEGAKTKPDDANKPKTEGPSNDPKKDAPGASPKQDAPPAVNNPKQEAPPAPKADAPQKPSSLMSKLKSFGKSKQSEKTTPPTKANAQEAKPDAKNPSAFSNLANKFKKKGGGMENLPPKMISRINSIVRFVTKGLPSTIVYDSENTKVARKVNKERIIALVDATFSKYAKAGIGKLTTKRRLQIAVTKDARDLIVAINSRVPGKINKEKESEKVLVLGRWRTVHKRGRGKYVKVDGQLVLLRDARSAEKAKKKTMCAERITPETRPNVNGDRKHVRKSRPRRR